MKYLKVFIYFVLCLFNVSETIRFDEHENILIIVKNLISTKYENWTSIMNNRKIIIIDQFQTMEEYITRSFEESESRNPTSSQTELIIKKIQSNILENLSFMYAALKCEYAHLVRAILQHIFHYEDLFCREKSKKNCIVDILNSLEVLRTHLDRVIFNLFNFKELSLNLKSSDHTLTVLLLNMHMFLCNKDNIDNTNKEYYYTSDLLKKLVRYTISSIENFICKKCLFEFTELDKTTNIRELQISKSESLDKYLSLLKTFSDMGLINNEYNLDMYNQNNYLMFNSAKKLNDITLKKSQPDSELKKTINIIQSVKKSYDLKNALKYQIFFIELLRSIFSVLIIKVIKNINNVSNEKTNEELNILYNGFHKYIEIIPDNYPPTHLHFINEIKKALEPDFQRLNSHNIKSLANIKNTLIEKSKISETENSQIDIMNIDSVNNFLVNIKLSKEFPSFKQTFELFLQEPNIILNDYYVLEKTNSNEVSSNGSIALCTALSSLWTGFVWFLAMLETITDTALLGYVNESLKTIIDHVNDYNKTNTNLMIKRTLLDFLNYFTDPKFRSFVNIDSSEFDISKQFILGTLISLHFHERNNCESRKTATIYEKLDNNKQIIRLELTTWFTNSKVYIQRCMSGVYSEDCKKDAIKYKNDASISNDQNERTSIDIIKRYSIFYKKQVLNVCQDLYQNIKIPDNYKMDKLQMTILEWYVSQAYAKVMCMFQFEDVLPSKEVIVLVKKGFKILKSLTFSTYFMRIIHEYINIYLNYFAKEETIEIEYIQNFIDVLKNQFEVYDVSIDEFGFNSIDEFYNSFKSDIAFLQFYFIDTNNNKLIVDEKEIPMSMFMDE